MNTCSAITPADLHRGTLCLIFHPHPTLNGRLLGLAAELAAACQTSPAGPSSLSPANDSSHLMVLDGGNCFNVYPVARLLRRHTSHVTAALAAIQVARAFTCFEMASLLKRSALRSGPPPAAILVIDFLSTFRDENVPLSERQRLLHTCLPPLRRLAEASMLLVTARPADPDPNSGLTHILLQAADQLLELDTPQPPPGQLALPFLETNHLS